MSHPPVPATRKIWCDFIEDNVIDPKSLRPEVASSWERCRDLQLDPYESLRADAGHLELRERTQQRRQLVNIARPFMQNLYNFVRGSGFQVVLSDQDGYLLEVIGDSEILSRTRQVQLCPGGNWNEAVKGTNAIGTAIVENSPVQVYAWEHYCQAHHFLTCSAAPIHDPEGQVLGVLDITGDYRYANAHTLGMVVAAVNAIENQLRLQKATTNLYMAYRYSNALLESMSEGLISIDNQGLITEINATGGRILNVQPAHARGRHINEILKKPAPMLQVLSTGSGYRDREILLEGLGKKIVSSATLLRDDAGNAIGAVAVIREPQDARIAEPNNKAMLPRHCFADIIGDSRAMREARAWAQKAAATPATVLISGESGTGKELFAQSIHNASPRCRYPFVAINCAAIPENLIESELFGYEEGTFTGAKKGGQTGKFEVADGGTVFLDEIGDMPLGTQVKLLRAIQEKRITRVGSTREIPVNIRIIAATHRNLEEDLRSGRFREDLYYRLNVVVIPIAPLRERPEDIDELARHMLEKISARLEICVTLSDEGLQMLARHDWPGNVRELENVLERASIRAGDGGVIDGAVLEFSPAGSASRPLATAASSEVPSLREVEKDLIARAIAHHAGNIRQASASLGIGRNTLYRKIKEYGLDT